MNLINSCIIQGLVIKIVLNIPLTAFQNEWNFVYNSIMNRDQFFKTGVIWHRFLERVTTHAAIFCTLCSWLSSSWGRPYNIEFAISKREVTKACTTCSEAVWFRNLHNLPILGRWKAEFWTKFETQGFNDTVESNRTPRLRTMGKEGGKIHCKLLLSFDTGLHGI